MSTPSTVRVDDDFAASEATVTLGTTDGEETRWVHVIDCLIIQIFSRDDRLDDLLLQVLAQLFLRVRGVVLSRDDNGVHAEGTHGAISVLLVLDGHLGLAVRVQEGHGAVLAHLSKLVAKAGRKGVSEWHHLRGLVSGVTEHVALVTGADVFRSRLSLGHSLTNLNGLPMQSVHESTCLVVKALLNRVESYLLDGLAHDSLEVDLCISSDLSEYHHEAGARDRLACHLHVCVCLRECGMLTSVTYFPL